MTNGYFGAVFSILFYTWIGSVLDKRSKKQPDATTTEDIEAIDEQLRQTIDEPLFRKARKLRYIVNGSTIPCTFQRYYYIKLGWPLPEMKLDREMLERQYLKKKNDLTVDLKTGLVVEGANQYFTDRLNYFSQLN